MAKNTRGAKSDKVTGIVKPVPASRFASSEGTAEMRWNSMQQNGFLTPNDLFFVRNHTNTPPVDVDAWRLRVRGDGVTEELTLGYAELESLPQTTVVCALECAGNGRSLFADGHAMELNETPWKLGAIGVAEWRGVALGEVLRRAGHTDAAVEVMPVGLDDMRVRRPLPVAKATAPDTILALEMNGEVLPPDHGYPVRVVVPGWAAVASIKWVGELVVSTTPLTTRWNTETYVLKGPGFPSVDGYGGEVITTQDVKSALELAWPATIPEGRRRLAGRAWSGTAAIAEVDYSIDGGPWRRAELIGPNPPGAWVRFSFLWDAPPGEHVLRTRAMDRNGQRQPEEVRWNERAYLYDAICSHPVTVTGSTERQAEA